MLFYALAELYGKVYRQVENRDLQSETGGTRGVALSLLEYNREGDEEHVQQAVEHRHVQGDEENDQLAEEQLERHDQEDADALAERAHVEVLFRDPVRLTRLLAQLGGASREDGGRVGLGHGEGDDRPDDAREDERKPVQPAPAEGVGEIATSERSD